MTVSVGSAFALGFLTGGIVVFVWGCFMLRNN